MTPIPLRPFCLIRHGQTDANRDRIIAGTLDAMLTGQGRAGALALSRLSWPGAIALFSSPQTRALDTARLAFPGRPIAVIGGLRERDWGIHEGRPLDELPARTATPEAGEAWGDMLERVAQAIALCMARAGNALPVLVAHSGIIRAARALTGGDPHGPSVPNTTPCLFRPDGTGWREHPYLQNENCDELRYL